MMDLRDVEAFCKVAQHGSISLAATMLGVDQSILSRRVSALERVLGGRLFHRTGRGVRPTELGDSLVARARALIEEAAALEAAGRDRQSNPRGEVIVGAVPIAARGLVSSLTTGLCRLYPGIRLRILEGYSGQVEEWLSEGRVHIGLFNRYGAAKVSNAERLLQGRIFLIARKDHQIAARRKIAFRELNHLPLALPLRPSRFVNLLTGIAAAQHFKLEIVLEVGSTSLIEPAISASRLCTLAPPQVFAAQLKEGHFRAIPLVSPVITVTTWFAYAPHQPLSSASRLVGRAIRESVEPLKSWSPDRKRAMSRSLLSD